MLKGTQSNCNQDQKYWNYNGSDCVRPFAIINDDDWVYHINVNNNNNKQQQITFDLTLSIKQIEQKLNRLNINVTELEESYNKCYGHIKGRITLNEDPLLLLSVLAWFLCMYCGKKKPNSYCLACKKGIHVTCAKDENITYSEIKSAFKCNKCKQSIDQQIHKLEEINKQKREKEKDKNNTDII